MLENKNIHTKRSLSTLQLAAIDFAIAQNSNEIVKVFVKVFDNQNPVVFLIVKELPQLAAISFAKMYSTATLGNRIQVKAFSKSDTQNIDFLQTYGVSRIY